MLKYHRRIVTVLVTAGVIASSVLPAAARPVGGFHGGLGNFHAPVAAEHFRGPGPARAPGHPEFHPQFGPHPHMAYPPAVSRPHNAPGWQGPSVRQPYRPPPPYRYPPPPPPLPYYGGPYYGPGWDGPPYGPYGPGWGWNGSAWVPFAAFGAGALIGGGVAAATENNSSGNTSVENPSINPKHYQWCEEHYKSYRESDNTYQPYHGPRKQCLSPYY
ncbi:BA14K family protein [Martelella mediterranea]|uniref:Lectin-like protein BA14k n=1 Tax=Martelella mediterranea TaxID=293089 RepID=A0A4R3P444_9HYPH|nr:BA14K family protein [Martelella mediterranea]TCT42895.1 BA14K-like protein [Martelella mediterranea]